jgi:prephenate dehydrogenase
MKRRDLIAHLQQHGCVLVREGAKHSWWETPRTIAAPLFRDITKLATRWCEKYAGIWESRRRELVSQRSAVLTDADAGQ